MPRWLFSNSAAFGEPACHSGLAAGVSHGVATDLLRKANAKLTHSRPAQKRADIADKRVLTAGKPRFQTTADMVQPQADAKGLELRLEATFELPARLHSDPLRLKQMLLNLLSNSNASSLVKEW